MPIYSGNTFKRFLIDRYAMGFPAEAIMHEFKAVQGIDITEAEVEEILKDSNDEIHKREIELMKELSNHNVIGTLYNIQTQLNEARDIAKVKGDMKTYAQLTNTLLSSIEVLIKLAQNFKEREQNKIVANTQNNFFVIGFLEKENIIEVKDKSRLMRLMGIKEALGIKEEVVIDGKTD